MLQNIENEVVGAMSALVTPFKPDNSLDTSTYESLIKRQIKYGMDGCVPVGTTGESATLSHKEHKECIEIAVSTCKGTSTKVLAGAGSNSTQEAIELAKFAEKCGANAILCVTPYYNKPTQEGLFLHYKAVANATCLPLMLYNVPGRTGVNIEVSTAIRLFKEVKNIYAIKEASGVMDRVFKMGVLQKDLKVLSGDDALNFPILASGGVGIISVTGNLLPNAIVELSKNISNLEKAKEISNKLYNINEALFCQSNPIPVKAAMYLSGLLPHLQYRLPLCAPSKDCMDMLTHTLKQYEVQK